MALSDVYIIGAGETKFGELWDKSLRDLAVEAGLEAIKDANIYSRDLQMLYASNSLAGTINEQSNIAALAADFSGIAETHVPAVRVEASTASGGAAVREAYLAIKSGEYDVVMVGGVEKMTDIYGSEIIDVQSSILDREWESFNGATPAALAAITARRYMHDFKVPREDIAMIAVNDHANASMNPDAQYRNKITVEQVINSDPVAEPLNVFDCSPISDGASAIILASDEYRKKNRLDGIRIVSSAMSEDYLALHSRKSIYTLESARIASKQALERAGIKKNDISFLELNDSYSIYGLLELEDLGFAEKGKGRELLGEIKINGSLPVNPSGGLKAKGNPLGATGVSQFYEAYLQLKGKAGQRQVKGARYGMLHNMAGTGATSVVHIVGE
ncbi:probable 3-ketoacyl-CoA thiolase [Thermoplasma acidophilum]|uniref:Probable 3-ketoacyl-CoA thiolase n=1 Tax=Thermoplasma acidophilum (strain ATCC 25905 / DSM 1728 / JCM 9062 / NBRC 15155 / AMRC-C165) TaxID=273075 RepID=Q9HI86_THEAC|nr:thiolase domain-containing protein [Thermoplasma acidophilum]MCY0851337.1 thiolase domain-containing protein [Thermoplasma acidophilum]CAC12576.1 probable 3-ketoacyl-CoA thiolase [Thermoplasma acidophilum]